MKNVLKEESENYYNNKNNLNNMNFLVWNNNSCSFDSFIAAFYFSILPNINDIK